MAKYLKEFIERLLGIEGIFTDMITKTKDTMDDVLASQRDIETFMDGSRRSWRTLGTQIMSVGSMRQPMKRTVRPRHLHRRAAKVDSE
jgi:hypothetical protein